MCIFCKIINKEIPSDMIFEDEDLVIFKDINPRAKTHLLVVPRKHIDTIKDLNENEQDEILIGKMFLAARNIARDLNLPGYKLTFNVGKEGGQEVFHIHLHLTANS